MTYPAAASIVPAPVYARCSFTDVANDAVYNKGETYTIADPVLLETLVALQWATPLEVIDPEAK